MLVIMKHRDIHDLAETFLHLKTFRGLDILQIDAAERRLQRGDDRDHPLHIQGVDLDIKDIDPGEFLEEHSLALHHRLARERTNGAEAKNSSAIADNANKIGPNRQFRRFGGICRDSLTGRGNTGGIGQRQIALVAERFCRLDFQFPGFG